MLSYLSDYRHHFGPLRLLDSHTFRMVMAAITRPAYRRTAAVSAAEATVSAILGGALTTRLPGENQRSVRHFLPVGPDRAVIAGR